MKGWIPYVVAAVLGLGVAVVLFLPETEGKATEPTNAPAAGSGSKKKAKIVTEGGKTTISRVDEAGERGAYPDAATAAADGSPEPGTLRPLNEGEISRAARADRPFNKHYVGVAQYWNRLGPLIGATDPDLAKACREMDLYLRDQSKLNDGDIDVNAVIEAELQLEKKVRTLGVDDPQVTAILDYINSSANSVIQGGDPSAIPKPGKG